MYQSKTHNQSLRVIDSRDYEVTYSEQVQEAPQSQPNGFVELGKLSFAASFGASLGWWFGEFVAGCIKVAVVVGTIAVLELVMWIKS